MLADLAYILTNWCITPFKTPRGGFLTPEMRKFNKCLSGLRIKIEHTIGRLKARFSYLRVIPNKGNLSQDQLREIYKAIGSAVILHNMLHLEDPWEDDINEEDEDLDDPDMPGGGGLGISESLGMMMIMKCIVIGEG